MMIQGKQKVMPVMVSFFTHGWMQQCVNYFRKWFPELKILVIDNNPDSRDQIKDWNFTENPNPKWMAYFDFCLAESEWLSQQDDVILLKVDREDNRQITHGQTLDLALEWCKENNIPIMLCVEPDVEIKGTQWFYNLLKPIEEGKWASVRKFRKFQKSYPDLACPSMISNKNCYPRLACPSMFRVDKIKWSFTHVIVSATKVITCPTGAWPDYITPEERYADFDWYDTCNWVYHKCNEQDKAEMAETDVDFGHYFSGSYKNFTHKNRNCPLITFI